MHHSKISPGRAPSVLKVTVNKYLSITGYFFSISDRVGGTVLRTHVILLASEPATMALTHLPDFVT